MPRKGAQTITAQDPCFPRWLTPRTAHSQAGTFLGSPFCGAKGRGSQFTLHPILIPSVCSKWKQASYLPCNMEAGQANMMKSQTEELDMQSNQEFSGAPKKNDEAGDQDSVSDDESAELASTKKDEPILDQDTEMDSLSLLRREKRLAMNRESARARRKRKKMLITTLEQKVTDLTRSNDKIKGENEQLVLRVQGLTERLANQEEELVLLRALAAQIPDAQLVQHLTRTQPRAMALPNSPHRSDMVPGTVPSLSTGIGTQLAGLEDISVRRLLNSQVAGPTHISAIGNHPVGHYSVPINRSIEQDILGRIGRQSSDIYNQILSGRPSNSVLSTGLDAALASQNTLRVPPARAFYLPPAPHPPLRDSSALMTSSESSGGASRSLASFNSTDDPRTALLLQQLLQERQQQAKGQRFYPG